MLEDTHTHHDMDNLGHSGLSHRSKTAFAEAVTLLGAGGALIALCVHNVLGTVSAHAPQKDC